MNPNLFSWAGPLAVIPCVILVLTVLGLPVSLFLLRRGEGRLGPAARRGAVLAAPLFGLGAGALAATAGLRLHLDQGVVLLMLLLVAAAFTLKEFRHLRGPFTDGPLAWQWLAAPAALALLTVALHSSDFTGLRAGEYFPRTNDDTFIYLGAIDQVAAQRAMEPPLRYPSGISTRLLSIVDLRAACVGWAAGLTGLLHLEPHIVFFGIMRTILPLGVVGVFALGALLEWPLGACLAAGWLFGVGNFVCHQVFQQFLSSAAGLIGGIGALCVLLATVRGGFRGPVAATGALATAAAGMLGPEGFPLLVAGAGAGLALALWSPGSPGMRRSGIVAGVLVAVLCAGTVGILLPGLFPTVLAQARAAKSHPGDWVAQRRFLSEALGLTAVLDGGPLPTWNVVLLCGMVPLVALGVWRMAIAGEGREPGLPRAATRFLGGAMLAWIGLFAFFLLKGRGYAMLKVNDYFCFVCPLALVAGARWLVGPLPRRLALGTVTAGLIVHAATAYPDKLRLLDRYGRSARLAPPPSAYRLEPGVAGAVLPELGGYFPLNLFAYMNRWGSTQILFAGEDSVRFLPAVAAEAPDTPPADYLFRLAAPPMEGDAFADVDRTPGPGGDGGFSPLRALAPNHGCVRLVNPPFQPNPAWGNLEGVTAASSFRWLLAEGRFRVYGPAAGDLPRQLVLKLSAGPHLSPENVVRVVVNGQPLPGIPASELLGRGSREFRLPLPAWPGNVTVGTMVVDGPRAGLYQLAVQRIYVQ